MTNLNDLHNDVKNKMNNLTIRLLQKIKSIIVQLRDTVITTTIESLEEKKSLFVKIIIDNWLACLLILIFILLLLWQNKRNKKNN